MVCLFTPQLLLGTHFTCPQRDGLGLIRPGCLVLHQCGLPPTQALPMLIETNVLLLRQKGNHSLLD